MIEGLRDGLTAIPVQTSGALSNIPERLGFPEERGANDELKKIIALAALILCFASSHAMAARDGSGTMSIPYPDFIAGVISSTQIDDNNAAITLEITNSIPRDGQAAPTAKHPIRGL